jgi:hypothetical protein
VNKIKHIKNPIQDNFKINKEIIVLGEDYPLFCFKYLSTKSFKKNKNPVFLYDFLLRLNKLSNLGWKEIRCSNRHKFGMEQIPVNKIKAELPPFITPDIKNLHVFRANSNNNSFVGLQCGKIFRIIFIEANFDDIYDHNRK